MESEIEQRLAVLIGKELSASGYSCLQWFYFGNKQVVKDYKGNERTVGEFSLNVSTAWRLKDAQNRSSLLKRIAKMKEQK